MAGPCQSNSGPNSLKLVGGSWPEKNRYAYVLEGRIELRVPSGPEGTYHHLMGSRGLNAEENKRSVNKTDRGPRP